MLDYRRDLESSECLKAYVYRSMIRLPSTHDPFFVDHDRVLHHPEIIRESLLQPI